ncbi:DUF397 domain-containing protein [Streptomyces sp. RK9]|uniref:DUF397 domain-containing protein n=1 Tax=Streptomyces sp. RK9 TaxID=3239284 RepID=UPI00386B7977
MSDELKWFKSSHSDGEGGACVEVALGGPDAVHIRDSKQAHGQYLHVAAPAWKAFISASRSTRKSSRRARTD